MIENNRNNEQIYGRNDMIMLDQNNKIYGSLGLADNYVMKTEEGTRLALSNPKQGRFGDVLTEFNMYGRSEQKQYSGKNLLKVIDGVKTTRGVTVIAKDGVVALKGTATTTGWAVLKIDSFILNGTYIFSSNLTDVIVKLANKSYKEVISQNESKTLENEEVSILCFVVKEGKTYDVSNILVQIEKGSEVTSYEPYVGGNPSPSPDYPQEIKSVGDSGSIEVNVRGKNLLNPALLNSTFSADGISAKQNSDGRYTISGTPTVDGIINTWIGGGWNDTVTIFTIPPGNYYSNVLLFYYDGKNRTSKRNAFTLLEPFRVTGVMYSKEYAINEKYNFLIAPQLELGSTATSYEPYYEEQTVTLPYTLNAIPVSSGGNYIDQSGQQWIADYVDLERGKLVKKLKSFTAMDIKTLYTWGVNENADNITGFYFYMKENGFPKADNDVMASTILRYADNTWGGKTVGCSMNVDSYNDGYAILNVPTHKLEDISSDKNACASFLKICENTNAIFFYSMASPVETDLAPEEIERYKKLSIRTPITIVENNYNTWVKATYKSTESV